MANREASSDPDREQKPLFLRTGFLLSVGFLVLIALIAVAVFVGGGDGSGGSGNGAGTPSDTPGSSSTTRTPVPGDTAIPTKAPSGVTWVLVHGISVPTSPTAGPLRVNPPIYAGFAHTPTGALLAAGNIAPRAAVTSGNGWRRIVREQTMPGRGQRAYIKERAKEPTPVAPAGGYGQMVAFRYLSYTPNTAVITVVHKFSDGLLQANDVTMRWSRGDWRLQFTDQGGDGGPPTRAESLSGYIRFGGF